MSLKPLKPRLTTVQKIGKWFHPLSPFTIYPALLYMVAVFYFFGWSILLINVALALIASLVIRFLMKYGRSYSDSDMDVTTDFQPPDKVVEIPMDYKVDQQLYYQIGSKWWLITEFQVMVPFDKFQEGDKLKLSSIPGEYLLNDTGLVYEFNYLLTNRSRLAIKTVIPFV